MSILRDAARSYAQSGWRVLPVWWLRDDNTCGCGNPFCEAPGKHPLIKLGRRMAAATNDVTQVLEWWDRWPKANIAVATGSMSGIIVVDLDLHDEDIDGEVEFMAWAAAAGFDPPPTLTAETGGGGRHLVYKAADGEPHIRNATAWLPGVDLRGEGGYVLVAPSTHVSGREYRWLNENPIAELGPLLGPLRLARGNPGSGLGRNGEQPNYDYKEACRSGPPRGTRDHFFNARAFELRKQDIQFDAARRELRRAWELCEQTPGDEFRWETVEDKLRRVWEDVTPEPIPDWDPLSISAGDPTSPRGKDTDLGNAQRFVDLKSSTVRHTAQMGWFTWDGKYWKHDSRGSIVVHATDVVESLFAEAQNIEDPDRRDGFLRWAKASESSGRIDAMLKLARGLPPIAGEVTDFNPDPWLMNVSNGVIDLRTGDLLEHDPSLLINRISEVTYEPDATDRRWDEYLKLVTEGDDELIAYLRRAAGYTLTADTREEVFFIIYGPQASGKSTFVDMLMTILGDMAMLTQAETLTYQRGSQAPKEELASMLDKRMVATIEMPDGGRFAESLVKQMTGGDKIAARHLYKDRFEFQPVFKLWIATNHAPRAYDDAIWRRIKRVPFPVTIPLDKRDPRLKAELKVARTDLTRAALAWAVQGCLEWQRDGLGTCAAVEADTASYETEMDKFGRFIEDELVLTPTGETSGRDLYDRYRSWCEAEGERPMTSTAFSIKLKDRGFEKNAATRPVTWIGLELQARSMYGV